ncbi:hypothetical protein [Streptomyces sp. NPDC056549]|uniref:hypothetical protein n=1 Tax=Streptomyces sp. NPDC056549 TaxID=3345864 RepID=UPI0036C015A1
MDDPLLELTDDPEGEDRLSGWMTGTGADTLASFTTAETGASLRRLTAPRAPPRSPYSTACGSSTGSWPDPEACA